MKKMGKIICIILIVLGVIGGTAYVVITDYRKEVKKIPIIIDDSRTDHIFIQYPGKDRELLLEDVRNIQLFGYYPELNSVFYMSKENGMYYTVNIETKEVQELGKPKGNQNIFIENYGSEFGILKNTSKGLEYILEEKSSLICGDTVIIAQLMDTNKIIYLNNKNELYLYENSKTRKLKDDITEFRVCGENQIKIYFNDRECENIDLKSGKSYPIEIADNYLGDLAIDDNYIITQMDGKIKIFDKNKDEVIMELEEDRDIYECYIKENYVYMAPLQLDDGFVINLENQEKKEIEINENTIFYEFNNKLYLDDIEKKEIYELVKDNKQLIEKDIDKYYPYDLAVVKEYTEKNRILVGEEEIEGKLLSTVFSKERYLPYINNDILYVYDIEKKRSYEYGPLSDSGIIFFQEYMSNNIEN